MNLLSRLNKSIYVISALVMFALSWVIAIDVTGRGVFSAPLVGTHEIVSNTIVAIAFLQLAYSIEIGGMLRSGVLTSRAPLGLQRVLAILRQGAGGLIFALVAFACWGPMLHAWETGEYFGAAQFRYPTYPIRTIIFITAILACLVYLSKVRAALRADSLELESS